jgi:hypothetical protein
MQPVRISTVFIVGNLHVNHKWGMSRWEFWGIRSLSSSRYPHDGCLKASKNATEDGFVLECKLNVLMFC